MESRKIAHLGGALRWVDGEKIHEPPANYPPGNEFISPLEEENLSSKFPMISVSFRECNILLVKKL